MPLIEAERNAVNDFITGRISHVSLHTADPGSTGTSEVTGGTPAYARKAVTWAASAAGNSDMTNVPVFDIPAGVSISYLGYWSALTGGTFRGSKILTGAPLSFAVQGTYTLNDLDLTFS